MLIVLLRRLAAWRDRRQAMAAYRAERLAAGFCPRCLEAPAKGPLCDSCYDEETI